MNSDADRAQQSSRDAQVVVRVLDGERDGFRELVERYQARVHVVVLRLVGNKDDAQDLTQQAFLDAFRALARFDTKRSFYSWLMRIAVNKSKDYLKSHKRREGHFTGEITEAGALFTGTVAGPEQQAEQRERLAMVQAALGRMDEMYRIPLLLKELDGMSYEQMQQVLDLPLTTLKIRVVRARNKLREEMASWTSDRS